MVKKNEAEHPPGALRCKGGNGTITFDGTWVTIDRGKGMLGGLIAPYGTGEKKLALSQISSVQWKAPSEFASGYLSFTVSEGTQSLLGVVDENKVTVPKSREDEFLALKTAVEAAIAQHHAPTMASAASAAVASAIDPGEHLKKLADIHKRGLITDEEYAAKRAAIVEKL